MHGRRPGNHHIIMPGLRVPRHNTRHSLAQSALGAVALGRATDPPAGRITNTKRHFVAVGIFLNPALNGRSNGLQNQSRHGRFAALRRSMEKFGPLRQAGDPLAHRPTPPGVYALWRGAWLGYAARRRFSYGTESRAAACGRYCLVEMFASMACLRNNSRDNSPAPGRYAGLDVCSCSGRARSIRSWRRKVNAKARDSARQNRLLRPPGAPSRSNHIRARELTLR